MATELTVPHVIDWTRGGIHESWPKEGGFSATVAYLIKWEDRFEFYRELKGGYFGGGGFNEYTPPFAYPENPVCYCQEAECEPIGDVNRATGSKYSPYEHALVRATFRVPDMLNTPEQQADRQWVERTQIDPENPIVGCRQRIRLASNYRTVRQAQLKLIKDGVAPEIVETDDGIPENRVIFELTFPRVFFFPWKFLRPYVGKVSSHSMFGLPAGYVLFQTADVEPNSDPDGLCSSVSLVFEGQLNLGWNQRYDSSGQVRDAVYADDADRQPILTADLREIFR